MSNLQKAGGIASALLASFALLPLGLLGVLLAPVWNIWLGLALLCGSGGLPRARQSTPQESPL